MKLTINPALPLAALALAAASANAALVIHDTFEVGTPGLGNGTFNGRTPDTINVAGNTYTEQQNNPGFGQFELVAGAGVGSTQGASTGFNNAAHIQYSNSGLPNATITISLDIQINSLSGSGVRGVGVGFYDLSGTTLYPGTEPSSSTGFTGLVVNPGGTVTYVLNGAAQAESATRSAYASNVYLGLSYTVDTTTGQITNVLYGGEDLSAGFSSITNFVATDTAGFYGSEGSAPTAFGYVDNFTLDVEPIPEPSAATLLGLGGLALLRRRRK